MVVQPRTSTLSGAPNESASAVVLVVDDDAAMRGTLQKLLKKAGYTVRTAADGAAGLACVEAGDIDLVLLDRRLPDLDGLELCRRVRAHDAEAYLPIIVLTGLADDAQRHAGFAVGADDYVTKPFKTQELLDRVRVWVRTRQYLKRSRERAGAHQLREQLFRDETLLTMTSTAIHELARLLGFLLNLLELWESNVYSPEGVARLRTELQGAANDLATRVNALTGSVPSPRPPPRPGAHPSSPDPQGPA